MWGDILVFGAYVDVAWDAAVGLNGGHAHVQRRRRVLCGHLGLRVHDALLQVSERRLVEEAGVAERTQRVQHLRARAMNSCKAVSILK